ncbi:hypothetical protein A9236_00020 [Polynucleobacter sp. QLW-P1DATA-2]|uniref:hypothetical protein n=1 Tax=unclassified Polynucleobacter TaxID=2640945 RepID=UPI0008F89A82|nr:MULTISPECIES: hypothetical protein [unclassified Polynucleobacter]OIM97778.1 hypothetical protein A9235_10795 [Polynucleobacter sp. MWH-Tro8-2-5-gr]OIN03342.1 hypothetical protein A9236_00020 [Polynucleobacter sp. QLW-P1DATA-2]
MRLNSAQKDVIVSGTIGKLDELVTQRNAWQVNLYDKSNKALYTLLGDCLDVYWSIKGSAAEKEILDGIKITLKARGTEVQSSTPVLTLLVKYVFNAERRRASTYSRTLRVAVNEKINGNGFAEWVAKHGGIEEITNSKGATEETLKKRAMICNKVEEVKDLLIGRVDKPLSIVPKTNLVLPADSSEYTLLLGKMLPSGETKVLSVVPNSSSAMLDQAIRKIAEALIKQIEEFAHKESEKLAEEAMAKAVNDAMYQMFA